MLTKEKALAFAQSWVDAFNSHDLQQILMHYSDELTFYSPLITQLGFDREGVIRSKSDLERYFEVGLKAYPDLHFKLHHCFTGVHSLVVYYTSVNGKQAAETFELDDTGKAIRVFCHYA